MAPLLLKELFLEAFAKQLGEDQSSKARLERANKEQWANYRRLGRSLRTSLEPVEAEYKARKGKTRYKDLKRTPEGAQTLKDYHTNRHAAYEKYSKKLEATTRRIWKKHGLPSNLHHTW